MVIIPYFAVLMTFYDLLESYTRDKVISLYTITISINLIYIYINLFITLTPTIINHVLSIIIAYYLFDINHQSVSNQKDKWTFIIHHIITIQLLLVHAHGLLPLSTGIQFLTYFEYSNMFLQLFQICNKKKWKAARDIVSLPFIFTYVPLRLVVIPVHSIQYFSFLTTMSYSSMTMLYLVGLITFVDIFSMYFAIVVAKKAYHHYVNGREV